MSEETATEQHEEQGKTYSRRELEEVARSNAYLNNCIHMIKVGMPREEAYEITLVELAEGYVQAVNEFTKMAETSISPPLIMSRDQVPVDLFKKPKDCFDINGWVCAAVIIAEVVWLFP